MTARQFLQFQAKLFSDDNEAFVFQDDFLAGADVNVNAHVPQFEATADTICERAVGNGPDPIRELISVPKIAPKEDPIPKGINDSFDSSKNSKKLSKTAVPAAPAQAATSAIPIFLHKSRNDTYKVAVAQVPVEEQIDDRCWVFSFSAVSFSKLMGNISISIIAANDERF